MRSKSTGTRHRSGGVERPRPFQIEVLYDDDDMIVVNKPAGIVVHRAPGYPSGTMCDLLMSRYPEMAGVGSVERPGVVHRLDRETSGVRV